MKPFIYLFVFVLLKIHCRCELYSSISGLSELLTTELSVQTVLEQYIHVEQRKLAIVKELRYLSTFKKSKDNIDFDKIYNPINGYFLINRLVAYWKEIVPLLKEGRQREIAAGLANNRLLKFPSGEDWNGASAAVVRLQRTYHLPIKDLAAGKIFNVSYGEVFSSYDCFRMGLNAMEQSSFHQSEEWFREAYRRHNKTDVDIHRTEIAEKWIDSLYELGNYKSALQAATGLASTESNNEQIIHRRDALQKLVKNNTRKSTEKSVNGSNHLMHFEELCRKTMGLAEDGYLKCSYKINGHPFLTLAPFKMEQVNREPDIFVFHDVLSDVEIMDITNKAQQLLVRAATVRDDTDGKLTVTEFRVGQTAFLTPNGNDKLLNTITRRVEDFTGLSQKFSEPLQVGNYGFGGHYTPHFDFSMNKSVNSSTISAEWNGGNRIATALFYLNDVEYGGATVFSTLKLKILPKKGSVLFWYNLDTNGDGDVRTLHGGCPVLLGTKWIATKWMHEQDQEFRRPCGLKNPPEDTIALKSNI